MGLGTLIVRGKAPRESTAASIALGLQGSNALTALVFAEKALPIGRLFCRLAGVGLIIYGVLVMFLPAALQIGM